MNEDKNNWFQDLVLLTLTPVGLMFICLMLVILIFK